MKKLVCIILVILFASNIAFASTKEGEAKMFIDNIVKKIEPVLKDISLSYWKATITASKLWYGKYEAKQIEYKDILSSKAEFKQLKKLKKAKYKDPLVKRQLDLLYLMYLENQIDPKLAEDLVRAGTKLEKKFYTYRATIDGVKVSDNEVDEILKKSKDLRERKKAWNASKQIGKAVSEDLVALVKLRNRAAKSLGFKNYYQMGLELQEQNEKDLFALLDSLARLTDKPYRDLKTEIDRSLAKRFKIEVKDMKPWHYEDVFFQGAPQIYDVDLDKYFKNLNVVKLTNDYYKSVGLDASDIIKRSDLYERKGKQQHAYCIHIDRRGDVRVLANVESNHRWTGTMLHELGHGVYDKYLGEDLPYILREPAHIFNTEGIAMMFGRLADSLYWYDNFLKVKVGKNKKSLENALNSSRRANQLVFARWVEVMTHFERELYSNPDQDLNAVWWELVERYQFIEKPEGRDAPDWAAKIHFTSAPIYYHNYLLGELFASQLSKVIYDKFGKGAFVDNPKLGEFLKEKVFGPGREMRWDKFIKFATGTKFSPKFYADEFIE